jgi:hypothetical protein
MKQDEQIVESNLLTELADSFDTCSAKFEENTVWTVQQALKAPSLDPTLKISSALFSLRTLVLGGGLQPTPEDELRELRGKGRNCLRGYFTHRNHLG